MLAKVINYSKYLFVFLFLSSLFAYFAFLSVELGLVFDLHADVASQANAESDEMGARSQYLNFIIGIPIAVVGVAATALLALAGNELVKRQAEIQATELADDKVTRELDTFIALINAFDEAIEVGDEIKTDLIPQLINDCKDKGVRPIEVLNFDEATYDPETDAFAFAEDEASEAIVALRRKWAPLFIRVGKTVEKDMAEIFAGYQRLTMDPFWATALAFQIGDEKTRFAGSEEEWARPLATIYKRMGDAQQAETIKSPRALGRELRYIAKNTKAWHSIHAFLFTPKDATPLEFVGAILSLTDADDFAASEAYVKGKRENKERLARREHPVKELKLYNVAAAMLISLYKALPAKNAIEEAVVNLFPEAGKSASKTLPNKRKVTSDALLAMIDVLYKHPTRLIYSENLVDARPQTIRDDELTGNLSLRPFWGKRKPIDGAAAPLARGLAVGVADEDIQAMRADLLDHEVGEDGRRAPLRAIAS